MIREWAIFICGIILLYFAILCGDGLHMWAAEIQGAAIVLAVIIGVVSFIGGGILWLDAIEHIFDETNIDRGTLWESVTALQILGVLFGLLAAPITKFGPFPWTWASAWDLLLVLALVPSCMLMIYMRLDQQEQEQLAAARRRD